MAMVQKTYTKLGGRRFAVVSRAARSQLWLGPDHLLAVDRTLATEEYRRFYFRDIEAMIIRRTANRQIGNWIMTFLGLLTAVPFVIAWRLQGSGGFFVTAVGAAAFWGAFILANSLRGATCQTHIRTAVQLVQLPSLNRISAARKALARLSPLILGAQGEATPEELFGAPWMATDAMKASTAAAGPLRAEKGIFHGALFGLLIAEAVVTGLYYGLAHQPLSAVGLILLLAGFIASIVALLRGNNSDISEGLRVVTKCAIGYYVLKCLAGFIFTMVYVIQHPGMPVVTGLEMVDEPGFVEASMISVAIAATIGVIGAVVLLGHLRSRPGSIAAP